MKHIALFGCLALAGCVTIYKSSDIIKMTERGSRKVGEFSGKVAADFAEKQRVYSALISSGAPTGEEPYLGWRADMSEISSLSGQIKAKAAEFHKIHLSFHAKLDGVSKVKSDGPLFQQVEALRERMETMASETESLGERYQAAARRFVDRAGAHSIHEIDAPALAAKIEAQLAELQGSVKKTRADLETLRERVRETRQDAEARPMIDTLEGHLGTIEREAAVADGVVADFRTETAGQARMLVAPHMASHTVTMKLDAQVKRINAEIGAFNATARELQKLCQ